MHPKQVRLMSNISLMVLSHCCVWDKRKSCVWKFIKYFSYAQKTLENTELGVWYHIEPMSCVWVAFWNGNVHKCPQMSAYDQRTMRMATVIIRKLYVKYVTQSSGIRQDVHIRCRYARHTLEVRYSYAINTLAVRYCTVAVRYIFMPTYGNACPPYLTYE